MKAPPSTSQDQHPGALLTGLFAGFASVLFTLGYLWPIAPLFPAAVAAIAAVLPFPHHALVARGALYAALGVAVFVIAFVPFLLAG